MAPTVMTPAPAPAPATGAMGVTTAGETASIQSERAQVISVCSASRYPVVPDIKGRVANHSAVKLRERVPPETRVQSTWSRDTIAARSVEEYLTPLVSKQVPKPRSYVHIDCCGLGVGLRSPICTSKRIIRGTRINDMCTQYLSQAASCWRRLCSSPHRQHNSSATDCWDCGFAASGQLAMHLLHATFHYMTCIPIRIKNEFVGPLDHRLVA